MSSPAALLHQAISQTNQKLAKPMIRVQPRRPLLTLCLATYNRARYLERYFTHHLTAFDVAGLDYEVIVSDNCSTDDTPDIIAAWTKRNPRIRAVRQASNLGGHGNYFYTIREARGEFVVQVADDDLLVPHQALAYVQRLQAEPDLAMIQAPWFMVDEVTDSVIGKFYELDGEHRFARGDFAQCLAFMIEHHVFPETYLIRKSAVERSICIPHPFAYNFFTNITRALCQGDVLFAPDPHVMITAISRGDNEHVGNRETMECWDRYRGGLEFLTSFAREFQPGLNLDRDALAIALQGFTEKRMAVALRLQMSAKHWANAYHLDRRLLCYGTNVLPPEARTTMTRLAALDTAVQEARLLGVRDLVIDDRVNDATIAELSIDPDLQISRASTVDPNDARRRGVLWIGDDCPAGLLRDGDALISLVAIVDRFNPA